MHLKIKEDNKNELSEMDIFLGAWHKRLKRIYVYIHINFKNYQIIFKLIICIKYQFGFIIILQLHLFS